MSETQMTSRRKFLILLSSVGALGGAAAGWGLHLGSDSPLADDESFGLVRNPADATGYQAIISSEEPRMFESADIAIRTLFDELGSGVVWTGDGRFTLDSQLVVPEGFRLSNTANGLFVNALPDSTTKCLKFETNTGSDYLRVDCGNMDGVLLGEANTGSDIDILYADIHRAGTEQEGQDALKIQGSGIKIYHVNIYQGQNGILIDGGYDVHILSSIVTNSGTGLRVDGAEHCFFDQMDFDSCRNYAVRIDGTSGLTLDGYVWNNPEFDAWPYRSVEIGVNQSCTNIYTNLTQLSNPGAALHVDDVADSHLRHDISEADRSWYEYESGITTTDRTADNCLIEGHVSSTIQNALSNIEGGCFNVSGAGVSVDTFTASGNGSNTTFQIPHGLDAEPTEINLNPRTPAAAGEYYIEEVDSSTITVTYLSTPSAGSDNLQWDVSAKL